MDRFQAFSKPSDLGHWYTGVERLRVKGGLVSGGRFFCIENIFSSVVADPTSGDDRVEWFGKCVLCRLRWHLIGRAMIIKFSPRRDLILSWFWKTFVINFSYCGVLKSVICVYPLRRLDFLGAPFLHAFHRVGWLCISPDSFSPSYCLLFLFLQPGAMFQQGSSRLVLADPCFTVYLFAINAPVGFRCALAVSSCRKECWKGHLRANMFISC